MLEKAKTFLAGLSVFAIVAIAFAFLFLGGELRNAFREKCGSRDAGWITRAACDLFDVVPPAPTVATSLADSDAGERADRRVAGPCETAQGLEILELREKDGSELERLLDRDLDGDGKIGRTSPRLAGAPARGELVFADKVTTELPRGGRVVVTAPAAGGLPATDSPAGDASSAGEQPAASSSGAVRVDVIPNEVPGFEWLHEIDYRLELDLPVNDRTFADSIKASADWTFARGSVFRLGLSPWAERLPAAERELSGSEFDYGAKVFVAVRCRGLFDCKPQ